MSAAILIMVYNNKEGLRRETLKNGAPIARLFMLVRM
jgi:hypothetical protein